MNIVKLLKILKEKKITRYQLAKMSGVSECTISRLIKGTNKEPKISTVKAIAKALEVDINEII